MNATPQDIDVLVIGAGMSGLMAAAALKRAGRRVIVLEKARGVGGRLASRRVQGATVDHGAQFITTRDSRFAALLEHARQLGAMEVWCHGFSGDGDGHARWRGAPSMNAAAKHFANGLAIHLETPVVAVRRAGDRWCVETATGQIFDAASVVLTAPVPQALALLDAGGLVLHTAMRSRLEAITYERCLAVLALLDGPSQLVPPGGLALSDEPIAWIADNHLKGVSAEPAVTIHATHRFSLEHWDRDRQESGRFLLEAAAEHLGAGFTTFQVHGWRYSKPMQVDRDSYVQVSRSPALLIAGDAFAGPRAEGAARSGWAAAAALLDGHDT